MKVLKIFYYISVSISLILLIGHLIIPYGGPIGIMRIIENGLFKVSAKDLGLSLNDPPLRQNPNAHKLRIVASAIAASYFFSMFICCLSPLFYKINPTKKYIIGVVAFCITILSFIGGGYLWDYLVHMYIGI